MNLDSDLVNVMFTCTISYMIVYTHIAAETKFIAKSNKTTTSASETMWTFWRLNAKLSNNLGQMNFSS